MKHLTASTSPSPFSGENWFDPLEDAIRFRVRAFIEAVVAEEAQAALGGRARYQRSGAPKGYRNGHRHRQLVGTFGALTVSLPRVRLLDGDGGEKEWRSQTIQAYKRLTKRAEAIIANTYLAGTNTRRVRRALAGLFGGKVGKDAVSRAWRKVKTDWESWQARDLSGEDIVRLILDGTGVKARLDGRVLSIPLLVVLGVRRDGQKVLLAVKNMGGETEAAWRHVLEDLLGRGLKAPELLIVDGGKGLEAALGQPVERYSGAALHGAQGAQPPRPCAEGVARRGQGRLHRHDVRRKRRASAQEAQGLPGQVAAPLPGRGGQPGRGGGAAVHLPALSAAAMEVLADHQRHRTPARGIQAPGEDPMRTTQRGNGGHAVLGLDGLGADHHAPRRWLANTRPSAGQEAD